MKTIKELIRDVTTCSADVVLGEIYNEAALPAQRERYLKLLNMHNELFGDTEAMVISTPGRTELGGNHTDHNHGNVLAGSVELDSVCVASKTDGSKVRFISEGYDPVTLDTADLSVRAGEKDTTTALLRGILFRFKELGYKTGGFNCNMDSKVLPGSGLSSSASIEVLIGTVLSELYNNGKVGYVEVSQIGQFAENQYFGKACGLMDQVACAAGGVVGIDFKNPEAPVIKPISYSFAAKGYSLMVTAVGSSHADLSDEYSAIPKEMRCAAGRLGRDVCRGITMDQLSDNIRGIRESCGDRAVLRAFHFINENKRTVAQFKALENDDFAEYLRLVNESGNSSFKYLQNIYIGRRPAEQALSIGLAFSEQFLSGDGACRVQGGGFAGTVQAYIPVNRVNEYTVYMERIFGEGCCAELGIRNKPACRVL